eukprot:5060470-Prymnesium_polylepis.2
MARCRTSVFHCHWAKGGSASTASSAQRRMVTVPLVGGVMSTRMKSVGQGVTGTLATPFVAVASIR